MNEDIEEDIEDSQEEVNNLKTSFIHHWSSHGDYRVVDNLEMRSKKTRLKTIIIVERNNFKHLATDRLIKGKYSSLIVV